MPPIRFRSSSPDAVGWARAGADATKWPAWAVRFLARAIAFVLLAAAVVAAQQPPRPAPSAGTSHPSDVAVATYVDEPSPAGGDDVPGTPSRRHVLDDAPHAHDPTLGEAAVEAFVEQEEDAHAAVVAVAHTGGDAGPWEHVASDGRNTVLRVDDSYGILSITKTFTAALVLRQAAKGLIALDKPMPALPGVRIPPSVAITPRMLLEHSSGLVNYTEALGYDASAAITPVHAVNMALRTPLANSPGAASRYANTNYHWLGLLLEHVSGRTYGELVDDIAAELGLHATRLAHADRPGWVGYASGGMVSTVGDLARWGAALFTPGVVLSAHHLDAYTRVGPLGVTLGLKPVCPCRHGSRRLESNAGVGQIVANGGLLYYPGEHMVVVVRFDPAPQDIASLVASLGERVRRAVTKP